MTGLRIAAIELLCTNPPEATTFYEQAFGARVEQRAAAVRLALGTQIIDLVQTDASPGAVAPSNSTGFQHCAIIVSDMEAAMAHLRAAAGWSAISRAGPEHLPASSGGVIAFKFRDPEGHPLELLQFAAGAVPPAWRDVRGIFLGVDHTAITVADTARAVAFYETLGFTVANRGVNRGPEQARMDDVEAPIVEVTGLTPPGGAPPHLELLCYREPKTVSEPRAPDDPLATRVVLEGGPARQLTDPDGHRLVIR